MKRIMLVEDDLSLAEVILDYLHFEGYWPEHFVNGREALAALDRINPHLAILDVMLPGASGFDVLKAIRKKSKIPVIMASAKSDDYNMMKGFEGGADDYMGKPFRPKILMAKVNALISRCYPDEVVAPQIKIHQFALIDSQVKVCFEKEDLSLTPKEYELFRILAINEGHIFTYDNLLKQIETSDSTDHNLTANSVSAHIKNIRKKIVAAGCTTECIKTIWGVGYKFEIRTETDPD